MNKKVAAVLLIFAFSLALLCSNRQAMADHARFPGLAQNYGVSVLSAGSANGLEQEINSWLKKYPNATITDMQYGGGDYGYSVMIIWRNFAGERK